MTISILDYDMGNIKSIENALTFLNSKLEIVKKPKNLNGEKIIIPGVGAFGQAMKSLEPFREKIKGEVKKGTPILGICLGLQAFFEKSEETSSTDGLGLLKGEVVKIDTDQNLPHIGWNTLKIENSECPLFKGVQNGYVYFVHSYHAPPRENILTATSDYGTDITASVWKDNIYGTQFHPEKSGEVGLKILKNFLEL